MLTASVIYDKVQEDGRHRVSYRYVAPGFSRDIGPILIAHGTDPQMDADARIPDLDSAWKEGELHEAIGRIATEGRYLSLTFNTQAELDVWLLKRMANADASTAAQYAGLSSLYTDTEVSAILGITIQQATDWRAKINALATYSSGLYYPEVEG